MSVNSIYLAARYSRRVELCGYRTVLQRMGYIITSRWLDTPKDMERIVEGASPAAPPLSNTHGDLCRAIATRDLCDIATASLFVGFSEPPCQGPARCGRHVELGFVLGLNAVTSGLDKPSAKQIILVGERENVFHYHRGIRFVADFKALVQGLTKDPAAGTNSFVTDN